MNEVNASVESGVVGVVGVVADTAVKDVKDVKDVKEASKAPVKASKAPVKASKAPVKASKAPVKASKAPVASKERVTDENWIVGTPAQISELTGLNQAVLSILLNLAKESGSAKVVRQVRKVEGGRGKPSNVWEVKRKFSINL